MGVIARCGGGQGHSLRIPHDRPRGRLLAKPDEVKRMKKEIKRAILDCSYGDKAIVTVVQDRFMELAKTKFR